MNNRVGTSPKLRKLKLSQILEIKNKRKDFSYCIKFIKIKHHQYEHPKETTIA